MNAHILANFENVCVEGKGVRWLEARCLVRNGNTMNVLTERDEISKKNSDF